MAGGYDAREWRRCDNVGSTVSNTNRLAHCLELFSKWRATHNNYAFTLIPKAALVYNTTGANYLRVTLTMNEVGTTYKLLFYDDRNIVGNDENATGYPAKAVMTEVYAV